MPTPGSYWTPRYSSLALGSLFILLGITAISAEPISSAIILLLGIAMVLGAIFGMKDEPWT